MMDSWLEKLVNCYIVPLSFIACIFGFILSVVGCFAPGKKIVYVERVKEVPSQQ